jgi:hypothetical protein
VIRSSHLAVQGGVRGGRGRSGQAHFRIPEAIFSNERVGDDEDFPHSGDDGEHGFLVNEIQKSFENFIKNRASEKFSILYRSVGCFRGGIAF